LVVLTHLQRRKKFELKWINSVTEKEAKRGHCELPDAGPDALVQCLVIRVAR
jgi:hypothetical protein